MMASCTILNLTVLLLACTIQLGQGASTGADAKEISGYTLLGQWQDPNSRNTRAITYYISDPGFEKTQFGAAVACSEENGGKLAYVLNKSQYDALRLQILSKGETNRFFWIDGQQVGYTWYYLWNNQQIQPSQLIWNPNCSSGSPQNMGLTLYGNVASFGMCNDKFTSEALRYICQFD